MKLLELWPVILLAVLVPIAYAFNPDLVVTPLLRSQGYDNWMILVMAGSVGTAEMILWYLGWRGISDLVKKWFVDDINFAKKVTGEMKKDGYLDWIKIHFTRKYKKLNEKAGKLLKGLKMSSYLGFLGLGFWPGPGPRIIGDFICGTTKWKGGLVALCIGNIIKTACFVFAWDRMFLFLGR